MAGQPPVAGTGVQGSGAGEVLFTDGRTEVRRQRDGDTAVIVKIVRGPDAAARARTETAILDRLRGLAGVPQLLGCERPDVVVVRDDDGVPLPAAVAREPLDLTATARDLAVVVAGVHGRGVVHRDISPTNILLAGADRHPVLVDYDLATSTVEDQPGFAPHREILGTLPYLAPEQTGRSGLPVDHRADLYAVGAVLYELATGEAPFGSGEDDELRLIRDILLRVPEPLARRRPDLPAALSDIVARLLEKEPCRRYQSAVGLAHDLGLLRRRPAVAFELGTGDFPPRLTAPSRLIGRDDDLDRLRDAFGRAVDGSVRAVLVAGAPGVGKSALVNQLRPWVAERGGWFVTGKSDEFRPDATGSVVQAVRGIGRLLLAEPEAELAAARRRLAPRIGPRIGEILPELAMVVGTAADPPDHAPDHHRADASPPDHRPTDHRPAGRGHDRTARGHDRLDDRQRPDGAPGDDPVEARARLRQAVLDLLEVVVSPDRPLVMVLDDLQWADQPTLNLVDAILTGPSLPGLLVVGTYRDDELGPTHPLTALVERWQRIGVVGASLWLGNLAPADLTQLVGDMLRLAPDQASALADAVGRWTAGNPYDTVEQVNTLRRDQVLVLGERGWFWDDTAVRGNVVRTTVAELLGQRLADLPAASRRLLHVADCLGGDIGVDRLAVAAGEPVERVRAHLRPALEEGLLLLARAGGPPGHADTVRFRHDRVRRTVHDGLSRADRATLRRELARRLAAAPGYEIEAAEQYLGVGDQLDDPAERRAAAGLYRLAAAHARRVSNGAVAERFLRAALDRPDPATPAAELTALRVEEHAALYSLGRLGEADDVYRQLATADLEPVVLAPAACLQVSSLSQRHRHREALDLGLDLLRGLGRAVPDGRPDEWERRLAELVRWVSTLDIPTDVARPELADARLLATEQLFSRLLPSAFFLADQPTVAWIVLESQRLWARYGPSGPLAANLSCVGLVAVPATGDYRVGAAVGRHVLAVSQARGYEPYTAVARHRYALHALGWVEPLEHCVEQARTAREDLVRAGDLQMASHTYLTVLIGQLECGRSLLTYEEEIEAAAGFAARTGNAHSAQFVTAHQEIARALHGAAGPVTEPTDLVDNPLAAGLVHIGRAFVAAVFGDTDALLAYSTRAVAQAGVVPGYAVTLAHLTRALALAEQVRRHPHDRAGALAELDAHHAWLAARAVDAPVNLAHLARLVEAERAAALDDFRAAAAAFDEAMELVADGHRPGHRALITERAAHLQLAHGLRRGGRQLLARARSAYADWGAAAKVQALDRAYPGLAAEPDAPSERAPLRSSRGSGGVDADAIDMMAILRASQALSSETTVAPLRAAVVEQLTALTGASDVLVALRDDDTGGWFLPGPGDDRTVPVEEAGRRGWLPMSAFRYAERTREPLLVADATTDDRFARDPYLTGLPRCALLVVPLLTTTPAILVLINRGSGGVFTADRLDAVMLIAGQLTVSVRNALLYDSLERRVAERTEALAAANRQLEILSVTDALTGLANRRRFAQVLDAEWDRAARTGQPLGIVMIDVDQFKRYNDSYGHLAGDECLRRVATTLAGSSRSPQDLIARYGGEEFAMILPGADEAGAHAVGERARAAVAALGLRHAGDPAGVVTVSVGTTAVAGPPTGAAAEAVAYADAAMYEAKKAGRNRVRSMAG